MQGICGPGYCGEYTIKIFSLLFPNLDLVETENRVRSDDVGREERMTREEDRERKGRKDEEKPVRNEERRIRIRSKMQAEMAH